MGGSTITTPSNTDRSTWPDEMVKTNSEYSIMIVDGDSVRLWVQALDVIGHSLEDEVLVHFDSSPAEFKDFWLVHDGETDVFVHSLVDLHEMR